MSLDHSQNIYFDQTDNRFENSNDEIIHRNQDMSYQKRIGRDREENYSSILQEGGPISEMGMMVFKETKSIKDLQSKGQGEVKEDDEDLVTAINQVYVGSTRREYFKNKFKMKSKDYTLTRKKQIEFRGGKPMIKTWIEKYDLVLLKQVSRVIKQSRQVKVHLKKVKSLNKTVINSSVGQCLLLDSIRQITCRNYKLGVLITVFQKVVGRLPSYMPSSGVYCALRELGCLYAELQSLFQRLQSDLGRKYLNIALLLEKTVQEYKRGVVSRLGGLDNELKPQFARVVDCQVQNFKKKIKIFRQTNSLGEGEGESDGYKILVLDQFLEGQYSIPRIAFFNSNISRRGGSPDIGRNSSNSRKSPSRYFQLKESKKRLKGMKKSKSDAKLIKIVERKK